MLEKDPLSADQARNLSLSIVAGERLLTILNSILDLSQIESGKFQLRHASFSLHELLTEVVDIMNYQANAKGIKVKSTMPKQISDTLLGDSGRIRQILINLVSNSIKFSNQGLINITTEKLEDYKDNQIELLFTISDSGDGISEIDQQKIFAAFERGKMESDIVIEGSGLGLAISSEFVEHMGGKLWLEKTDQNGSTFCFTIHCAIDSAPPSPHQLHPSEPTEISKTSLTDIHILLAEDEFINQRIITAYLEEMGARVTVCQHGKELLNKWQQEAADIILMDIRMPVMNGLEATERIRILETESSLLPIPIIALTAQATTEFEEKCRKAGMNDYLTKPVQFEKLIDIILDLVKT
jgi:CheY-like chemotaxis protein